MTLQSLMSRPVRSGEGARLGRVFGFRGERDGPDLRVTHIRVGLGAWIERLWPHAAVRRLFARHPALEIPWTAIAAVDREVHLKPEWDAARARGAVLRSEDES